MLVYSYKGKKSITRELYAKNSVFDFTTYEKLWNYFDYIQCDYSLHGHGPTRILSNEIILDGIAMSRHVYRTYTTLCRFNNILVETYIIDDEFIDKIDFINDYLQNNTDIKESFDIQCRKIYDKLNTWYYRITNNSNSLDTIKWEVARFMKYYEKKGIFKIASINLKRNYYDFVV